MNAEAGSILESAQRYAGLGWSVIPIIPHGKRPLVAWLQFQQRAAPLAQIDAWYRRWPDANVAIVTGRVSGLVVIDIDPAHGGTASLEKLVREHGSLPRGFEVATGGGGRHLYFAHPGEITPNRAGLYPGIDVRGDGGCVVAPPSIHPSGRPYRWIPGYEPAANPPAKLPIWALHVITQEPKHGHPPAP